ncbi:hypothetical protein AB0I72_19370 [Nocardiopsis sp. NPDC049922]|uniref:hypothetical protein n=1 Tax=Nocardiopsis sp. NPDC049922 TaxID=3155157 RepID=UPI003404AEF0
MINHRSEAERHIAEARQEIDPARGQMQAQLATAAAVLALVDAVADLRRPCPCETDAYDDWPMDPPARRVDTIRRPDLFGECP